MSIPLSPRTERLHLSLGFQTAAALTFWTGEDHGTADALAAYGAYTPQSAPVMEVAEAWAAAVTGDDDRARRLWDHIR